VPHPSSMPSADGLQTSVDPVGFPHNGTELEALRREIANLRAALVSRATIDQARGILVARYQLSPDGAFDLLVRWSQDRNIKLRTIAENLVTLAQHGLDGPGIDPALGRWLAEQLKDGAPNVSES
jgi:ANTAR domain